ncbi:hypothetical protein ACFP2T_34135 [Plantactinospora solaniradicis]|uniref:Uncharacterized protein n=1 Tax=Plantactinospora solaniradicis TaxID=1723736 RepID=A0ABW1KHK4_9ACTN
MNATQCPHCNHQINRNRLWYQCVGRGTPGRGGCRRAPDPSRMRETGWAEPSYPSFPWRGWGSWPQQAACPNCGGVTGVRVCPYCHTPVTSGFSTAPTRSITLVGEVASGKTVYLQVLMQELLNNARIWFDVDVSLGDDEARQRQLTDGVDRLVREGQLLSQTAAARDGRRQPVVIEWRQAYKKAGMLRRYRATHLALYDTAGEDLRTREDTQELQYLDGTDAIILVLDPFLIEEVARQAHLPVQGIIRSGSNGAIITRISEYLRATRGIAGDRGIPLPVAVVVSKFDVLFTALGMAHPLLRPPPPVDGYDETAGLATHDAVQALLLDWDAGDIDARLRHNFANFRYFAVSALGAPPRYSVGLISEDGIRPFRVTEPLLWLLASFNLIPQRQ